MLRFQQSRGLDFEVLFTLSRHNLSQHSARFAHLQLPLLDTYHRGYIYVTSLPNGFYIHDNISK